VTQTETSNSPRGFDYILADVLEAVEGCHDCLSYSSAGLQEEAISALKAAGWTEEPDMYGWKTWRSPGGGDDAKR
jgi:hypothetical protein